MESSVSRHSENTTKQTSYRLYRIEPRARVNYRRDITIDPSIQTIRLSVRSSVCLPVRLSVYQSVYLSQGKVGQPLIRSELEDILGTTSPEHERTDDRLQYSVDT